MSKMHLKNKIIINIKNMSFLIIIFIILLTYSLLKLFSYKSKNILNDYASRKSNNIISEIINKSIKEVLLNEKTNSIIYYDKDNISIDYENVNKITYLISENILDSISNIENNNKVILRDNKMIYYVPIGIISNIPILVNLGPKIPFKINILGSSNIDSNTKIKEYGINNSLIEVYVNINIQIQIILPFESKTQNVNKKIILSNKIIEGNIPSFYGSILENKNN